MLPFIVWGIVMYCAGLGFGLFLGYDLWYNRGGKRRDVEKEK